MLRLKCTKFNFGRGSAPYSAPPDSLAGLRSLLLRGGEGTGKEGEERGEGRELGGEEEGRRRGREGTGRDPPPLIHISGHAPGFY